MLTENFCDRSRVGSCAAAFIQSSLNDREIGGNAGQPPVRYRSVVPASPRALASCVAMGPAPVRFGAAAAATLTLGQSLQIDRDASLLGRRYHGNQHRVSLNGNRSRKMRFPTGERNMIGRVSAIQQSRQSGPVKCRARSGWPGKNPWLYENHAAGSHRDTPRLLDHGWRLPRKAGRKSGAATYPSDPLPPPEIIPDVRWMQERYSTSRSKTDRFERPS